MARTSAHLQAGGTVVLHWQLSRRLEPPPHPCRALTAGIDGGYVKARGEQGCFAVIAARASWLFTGAKYSGIGLQQGFCFRPGL